MNRFFPFATLRVRMTKNDISQQTHGIKKYKVSCAINMVLDVLILSPQQIIFEGKARSVILPGEEGFFEIAPLHKRIISRLLSGKIYVDEKSFAIKRGLIKAGLNKVTVIVEET